MDDEVLFKYFHKKFIHLVQRSKKNRVLFIYYSNIVDYLLVTLLNAVQDFCRSTRDMTLVTYFEKTMEKFSSNVQKQKIISYMCAN